MLVGCSVLLRIELESRVMVVLALSWNEIRVVFLSSEFILCGVDLLLSSARCARRTAELRTSAATYFLHTFYISVNFCLTLLIFHHCILF